MNRKPVVAGVFYPSGKNMLVDTIEDLFMGPIGPGKLPEPKDELLRKPVGLISPHAGYVYSGQVAAWGYYELSKKGKPSTVILIGPNHTGYGPAVSVYPSGTWETPLGEIEVDEDAVKVITENSDIAQADLSAHAFEHSIEVQLPFLQYLYGNSFKIVPITMKDQSPRSSEDLSRVISKYLEFNPSTVVIASTDLNHYESQWTTVKKDSLIIEAIEESDLEKLYIYIYENNITMCGYGAVAVLILLNLGKPQILKHATSGDVSGDTTQVVGYLSVFYD